MMSFDLSFRPLLIDEIVEDEGTLWTDGIISWISINIGSHKGKRVQFTDDAFCSCVVISLGEVFRASSLIFLFFNPEKPKNNQKGLNADITISGD